ncbi:hypothetical protein [Arsenophonus endosymbiont of Aleurodicus floccissimus]|uniref:hypothetical protein n=1 Tax=Arsenophonus endosymbiont of Aleurodicus floccissimus TaxID=2152761 RepID=UPI0011C41E78|nr:hypothetical protein [Arsenophonus endosymbiont of Aleurodicus floccissimus]
MGCRPSFTFVGLIVAVFWWLGKKGAQQRKNEIIDGRYLAGSVKEINRFLKAKGKLSPLKIGDLHLVENSGTTEYWTAWHSGNSEKHRH